MPHVQPETFRLFIQYVYTGKLLLHDSGVFEMMTLAADLGVEDLRAACEDHVTSTLSVESACTLLAAAMEIQDRPGGKSASSFMERCISFVGDNAADCIKTNAFLNLPKEALIKLISSDFLSLEEEEVWRCALAWAKQRAGVTQPTAHWTEEERARVCHHLAPLMQHVRLLLIDSAVFAEEVEPTGAVPMELSLERYRRAALHAAPRPEPDKRTQPRLAVNMFTGSVILQQDKSAFQSLLNSWCGTPKQSWRLVFRASTHGYSAQAFHSHCDGIAPVLLLVQVGKYVQSWRLVFRASTHGYSAQAFHSHCDGIAPVLLLVQVGKYVQSWRLVFRASTHGYSAQAFHSHCDGIAPVLLLVQVGKYVQSWRLVFRASTHGYSAQAFHSHCDGIAPVLLLVQVGKYVQSWRLVFRASTHGYSAQAFHSHCDGIAPVLLLVQVGKYVQSWRLVFRASTHGYSAQAFHSHCDGIAPVLLLVQVGKYVQSWRLVFRASTHGYSAQAFHSHCDGIAPVLLLVQVGKYVQSWRLVFRASTHGYSAQAFHSHCDGIAPVLLLVQLSRGAVIGGFCSAAWAGGGAGGYVSAERAFLFALTDTPQRHALVKKAFALCYHPDCGPIFGAGADLLLSHNCNANSDSYSNLHSYGDAAAPASLAHDYNFTVRDYEVFTLNHN
ncbi:uncharacterized protein [Maniola hyperantus]